MVGKRREKATLLIELAIAVGILVLTMVSIAFGYAYEHRLCRAYYYRAVAMEIVDGEMEILAAGRWKAHVQGRRPYEVRGEAAKNLPKGDFVLTVKGKDLRLEWVPAGRGRGGSVVREARVE